MTRAPTSRSRSDSSPAVRPGVGGGAQRPAGAGQLAGDRRVGGPGHRGPAQRGGLPAAAGLDQPGAGRGHRGRPTPDRRAPRPRWPRSRRCRPARGAGRPARRAGRPRRPRPPASSAAMARSSGPAVLGGHRPPRGPGPRAPRPAWPPTMSSRSARRRAALRADRQLTPGVQQEQLHVGPGHHRGHPLPGGGQRVVVARAAGQPDGHRGAEHRVAAQHRGAGGRGQRLPGLGQLTGAQLQPGGQQLVPAARAARLAAQDQLRGVVVAAGRDHGDGQLVPAVGGQRVGRHGGRGQPGEPPGRPRRSRPAARRPRREAPSISTASPRGAGSGSCRRACSRSCRGAVAVPGQPGGQRGPAVRPTPPACRPAAAATPRHRAAASSSAPSAAAAAAATPAARAPGSRPAASTRSAAAMAAIASPLRQACSASTPSSARSGGRPGDQLCRPWTFG